MTPINHVTSAVPAYTDPRACSKCGVIDVPQIGPGNGPHAFRETCRHCNSFIRWRSRFSVAERQARRQVSREAAMARKPPSEFQLAYLVALGYGGPPPATMLDASHRIDSLVRKTAKGGRP